MKKNWKFNLFYVPALLLLAFFVAYPFVNAFYISLFRWNGYSVNRTFIGIENYKKMFTDSLFYQTLLNTIVYGFVCTLFNCVLGLALAIFLNHEFPGRNLVRTIIYLPVLISNLIMGYVMYFVFQYSHGALNDLLALFGIPARDWLSNSRSAVIIITALNIWQFVGNSMIIFLAGLQGISQNYYEAAELDGANGWSKFRYITWPLLLPSTSSAVTLNLIGGLKLYEVIVALTGGGPAKGSHSLSTLIADQYFASEKAGYAAALGIFSFLFIMVVANISNSYFRRKERTQQ